MLENQLRNVHLANVEARVTVPENVKSSISLTEK